MEQEEDVSLDLLLVICLGPLAVVLLVSYVVHWYQVLHLYCTYLDLISRVPAPRLSRGWSATGTGTGGTRAGRAGAGAGTPRPRPCSASGRWRTRGAASYCAITSIISIIYKLLVTLTLTRCPVPGLASCSTSRRWTARTGGRGCSSPQSSGRSSRSTEMSTETTDHTPTVEAIMIDLSICSSKLYSIVYTTTDLVFQRSGVIL